MTTTAEHSRVMDAARNAARGLVRRMMVSKAANVIWQLAGVRVYNAQESFEAEVFQGVGFAALPPASGSTEAVVVNAGSANVPVIVATRDEKTRSATVPSSFKAGETCVFTPTSIVYLKDGRVEVRSPSGSAKRLATLDDLNALKTWIAAHTHSGGILTGGLTGTPSLPAPPSPAGTSVLYGE